MKFSEIIGNEGVKRRLRNLSDSDCLPHALIIQGPAGTYKLALARAFAQYINCQNHTPDGDSCGRCPSCLQSQSLNHIDTIYVYPVVKTDSGGSAPVSDDFAPQWREFLSKSPEADIDVWTAMLEKKNAHPVIYVTESDALIHKLNMTSHGARRRCVILWLPERLNVETANKLLKIIEEPHEDTMFIMVSDDPREVLPTIYSRSQRVDVRRLADSDIADLLVSRHAVDPAQAQAIAHNADGSMIRALRQISLSKQSSRHFDLFVQLMRLAYQRNVAQLKTWANDLAAEGREDEIKFYENAQRLVRENFIYNFQLPQLNYMTDTESSFSVKFARFITEKNVEKLISVFNKALTDIAANANGKIVNFDVALKVCFLIKNG